MRSFRRVLLGATASVSLLSLGAQAFAADPPKAEDKSQKLEEIVVTGTLLKGIAPVGTNVVGLNRGEIVASGATTAIDLLATVPQVSNAFNGVPNVSTGVSGQTIVRPSIRNIGAAGGAATLVLLNGHNMVGAGILQSTADANMIPAGAIERVDVVADGGSSLYGADAVAGTVNFITRKRLNGLEFDVHYGVADHYSKEDVAVTGGKTWSSGSLLLAYEYRHNSDLLGGNRSYFRQNLTPMGGSDNRVATCQPGNVTIAGVSYAMPGLAAGTKNLCDQDLTRDIFPEETQNSIFADLVQDVTDKLKFESTAYHTKRDTKILIPQITATGVITSANPYFQPIGAATSQSVSYNFAGPFGNNIVAPNSIEEFGVTPSLRYQINDVWQATLLGNFGQSKTTTTSPELNAAANTAALAGTTLATALDPYNLSATNPGVLQTIHNYSQFATATQKLSEVRLNVDGPVANLPGGDLRVAFGGQISHATVAATQTDAPNGDLSTAAHGSGSRTVEAVFGEVFIPIVGTANTKPMIHSLSIDASARYDHYSDFGGTTNPKIGVTYEPFEDFKIRGNYGTSFIAPSLDDGPGAVDTRAQFLGVVPFHPAIGDPAHPYTSADFFRGEFLLAGGSAGLQPETAHTYSIGWDYRPSSIPGWSMSLTYWNIEIYKEISVVPFFNPVLFTNPAYANDFIINPTLAQAQAAIGNQRIQGPSLASLYANPATAPYAILKAQRVNLGNEYLDGLDFNTAYRRPMDFGALNASLGGSYLLNQHILNPGTTVRVDEIAANGGAGTAGGGSRLRLVGSVGADIHEYTVRATVFYSSGFDVAGIVNQTHVGAFNPVNLYLAYNSPKGGLLHNLTVSLNIENLFDEKPAFENQNGKGTGDGIGNGQTVGRLFVVGVKKTF